MSTSPVFMPSSKSSRSATKSSPARSTSVESSPAPLRSSGQPSAMVTVRGLVRGVNVLLGRRDVRERLIPLRSDVMREVYVALPLTEAIELARAGWLEEENAEDVMELGGW